MSKNNRKTKSTLVLSLMIITVAFFIVACSTDNDTSSKGKTENTTTETDSNNANREAINKVLEHQFSGPDEKFIDLMWNPKYKTVVNNQEENKELDRYVEEVYGPYFTASGLDSFISMFGTQYPYYAYESGYKLSFKGVKIEQNENISYRYSFIANVGYQKNGDEEKTANVKGEIIFSTKEKGKIERFEYKDETLSVKLREWPIEQ